MEGNVNIGISGQIEDNKEKGQGSKLREEGEGDRERGGRATGQTEGRD